MKSKQLANVLIKVLGLSLCAQSVMHLGTGIFNLLANINTTYTGRGYFLWSGLLMGLIVAAIGIYFIVRSRNIAGCLFKDEGE
jgi:small neutral amino acid transporter SnatA (MarC family)